jgi:hypothetical protein
MKRRAVTTWVACPTLPTHPTYPACPTNPAYPAHPIRPVCRAILASILAIIVLGSGWAGCASHDRRPTPPASPLALGWISPAAGDTVAGLVGLEVEIHGAGVRSVIFLASGVPVDTATAPPWAGQWRCRRIEAPAPVVLQAVVQRDDGSAVTGGQIRVWVVPNRPPGLTLRVPRPTTWLERRADARLEAVALDPEDGTLPPGRVHWTGSALGRPTTGSVLPLEILREEEQRIVVEAADRWNECASETLKVRPFRYRVAETPSACADNAAIAVRAMDPTGLSTALADSFLFLPCADEATSAGWPLTWPRSAFLEMVGAWLLATSTTQVEFEWSPVRVNAWRTGRDERAWMECAQDSIRFLRLPAPPDTGIGTAATDGGTSRTERTAAVGSVMQLSLRRLPGGSWRITTWRELATGDGQSLAGLLASAAGLPAPRAGAGCQVSPMPRPPPRTRSRGSHPR